MTGAQALILVSLALLILIAILLVLVVILLAWLVRLQRHAPVEVATFAVRNDPRLRP